MCEERSGQEKSSSNKAQEEAAAYRLAELDRDFILGDSMRGVRLQLEYAKVEERLRAWGVHSTIVAFGGGLVRENGPLHHRRWYQQARRFAQIASQRGGAIATTGVRGNVIATGGGPGLMEAANRGASDVGAPSIGFNIALPHEQPPNPYSTPELTFRFQYFAIRKLHLVMRAKALIVFPGGFGTLDEMFEILTLKQTEKSAPIPIVLFDEAYWRSVVNFEHMIREGTITPVDRSLFEFASDAEEAWRYLEKHLVAR